MPRKLGGLRPHDPSLLAKNAGVAAAPMMEAPVPAQEPPAPIDMAQIEVHKENILPMKSGRKPAALSRAFGNSVSSKEATQRSFEDELADTMSDDPLEVWLRYIKFAEESFPEAPRVKNELLERCAETLKNEEQYKERY